MTRSALLIAVLLAAPLAAAKPPGEYRPYCALPNTRPLFLSPMGEPFRAAPGQPYASAAWFAGADRDHDGTVDRVEFVRDADRFFKTIDLDHDGQLTPEEIDHYERTVAPEIALYGPRGRAFEAPDRTAPRSGESGYGNPMGAGRYTWLNVPEPVASADLDVDRLVSEQEFASVAGRRFEQLAPKGSLTLATLPKTPQQMALEGPCEKRPKPKKPRNGRHPGMDPDDPDGGDDRGDDGYPRGGGHRPRGDQ